MSQHRLRLATWTTAVDLATSLENVVTESGLLTPGQLTSSRPLTSLLRLIGTSNQSGSFLYQFPIQERDYSSEYSTFYSKTFKSYSRYCARVHYFSTLAEDQEDSLIFLDRMTLETGSYLGFSTLRPIGRACVGRTILRPSKGFFLGVKNLARTKVAGVSLKIEGAPFIQQDSAVGMCVQASLWMALNATNGQHRKEPVTLADISSAATEVNIEGRVLPGRDGLTSRQIFHALFRFGYHGISINCRDISPSFQSNVTDAVTAASPTPQRATALSAAARLAYIKYAVYPYLESGVPVILVVKTETGDFHAVVLVGHDWHPNAATLSSVVATYEFVNGSQNRSKIKVQFTSPTTYIQRFFVNNDNSGPYEPLEDTGTPYSLENVQIAYPILHQSVYMTAEEALQTAQLFLADFLVKQAQERNTPVAAIVDRFVLRPYIQRRHDFRQWAVQNAEGVVRDVYRTSFLPSHVWVVELHDTKEFYKAGLDPSVVTRLGEIIIDATGDPNDLPVILLRLTPDVFGDADQPGLLLSLGDGHQPPKIYPIVGHKAAGLNLQTHS